MANIQKKLPQLVFARKYRPKDFDEIIGQEHISSTLKNAIALQSLAHAYLFCGPRGIGKTSTARILAKALNCKEGPVITPCNKCDACREINESRNLDVLEIDGASNRGIDEIRSLRENVKFAPSSGRFKIYIIDEVHMLTAEAFNALLKTLEEPPLHVKFIFATTEPHRVLPTILSRCQRFDFRKIDTPSIVAKLKALAKEEKITCEEKAFYVIAKSSDGSLRDAEVILDQMNSFSRGKIKLSDVNSVLGLMDKDAVFTFIEYALARNPAQNLILLDKLIQDGKDPVQILLCLTEHFREMMLIKCNCAQLAELSAEDIARTKEQAEKFTLEQVLYNLALLSQTMERVKKQGNPRLLLEMALIKLSDPNTLLPTAGLIDQLNRIEEKLKKMPLANNQAAQAILSDTNADFNRNSSRNMHGEEKPAFSEAPAPIREEKKQEEKKNPPAAAEKAKQAEQKEPEQVSEHSLNLEQVNKAWLRILETVKSHKISLGLYLAEGVPVAVKKCMIDVGFLPQHELHREALEEKHNLAIIEEIAGNIIEAKVRMRMIACEDLPENKNSSYQAQEEVFLEPEGEPEDSRNINEFVQSAIDVFNGRIIPAE